VKSLQSQTTGVYKPKPTGKTVLRNLTTPVDQQEAGFWLKWRTPSPRTYPYEKYRTTGNDVSLFHNKDIENVSADSSEKDLAIYSERLGRPVRPERDFIKKEVEYYRQRRQSVFPETPKAKLMNPDSYSCNPIGEGISHRELYRTYTTHSRDYHHYMAKHRDIIPLRAAMYRHLHNRPISAVLRKSGDKVY